MIFKSSWFLLELICCEFVIHQLDFWWIGLFPKMQVPRRVLVWPRAMRGWRWGWSSKRKSSAIGSLDYDCWCLCEEGGHQSCGGWSLGSHRVSEPWMTAKHWQECVLGLAGHLLRSWVVSSCRFLLGDVGLQATNSGGVGARAEKDCRGPAVLGFSDKQRELWNPSLAHEWGDRGPFWLFVCDVWGWKERHMGQATLSRAVWKQRDGGEGLSRENIL